MAAIVNDRDVLLQAASPRLLQVTLPPNTTVPPGNIGAGPLPGTVVVQSSSVAGLGALALQNTVNGSTQVTNLGLLAFANTLYANQLGSGTFPVGVVYSGTVNANQINAGTMSADRIYGGLLKGISLEVGSAGSAEYFQVTSTGYMRTWAAEIRTLTVGAGETPNPFPAGSPGIRLYEGKTLITEGVVDFRGRAANNGATLTVRGQGSSTNNHAGRFFYQLNDAAVIKSSVVLGSQGSYSVYTENGTVGPFTASHDALVPKDMPTEEGMVLEDVACVRKRGISDTIFEARPVQGMASKRRAGVVSGRRALSDSIPAALIAGYVLDGDEQIPYPVDEWADLCERYDLVMMNAVGEGQILVCGANGDIEQGDFISSSGTPGIGMRQDGDFFMTYTIAQSRESIHFESPSDIRLVACYYHCG